jgi:membrane protein DedA with SNARE-associated domain
MDFITKIFEYAQSANYLLLFVMYFIEGPISNFVSAMFAAGGSLNIWYIFVLAASAEILSDIFVFWVGRLGQKTKIEETLSKADNLKFFKQLNNYLFSRTFITLFLIKSTPSLALPSLLYIGRSRISFKTFLRNIFPISILRNSIISFLGYSSIVSINLIYTYYGYSKALGYVAFLAILGIIIFIQRDSIKTFFVSKLKRLPVSK